MLQMGEQHIIAQDVPALIRLRHGNAGSPLLVFLPGAAHLGRVAYGHPGCDPRDFLDHWLAERGWGLLALSHPIGHPVFEAVPAGLTVSQWAAAAAEIIDEVLRTEPAPRLLACTWSMSGRVARALTVELAARKRVLDGFIGLAATPPLPGFFGPISVAETPITAQGLRGFVTKGSDGRSYAEKHFYPELDAQNRSNGRQIMTVGAYRKNYLGDNPVLLHGEALRIGAGSVFNSYDDAIADLDPFAFADYPVMGVIAPTAQSDAAHAIAGPTLWMSLNTLRAISLMRSCWPGQPIPDQRWEDLRRLARDVPERLCRYVEGGHLFFVGARGARRTADEIVELASEIAAFSAGLEACLTQPAREPAEQR